MEKSIVLLHGDFNESVINVLKDNNVKRVGLHANSMQISVDDFLTFVNKNQNVINQFESQGISVEYQLHVLNYLLPRHLFRNNKQLFRMNERGQRTNDFNCCPSSHKALQIIEENAEILARKLKQKSLNYYLWIDDDMGNDVKCHCEKCKNLSVTKQNSLLYQAILNGIKKYNQNAKLSFLIYGEQSYNGELPKDTFIQFAPFKRRHDLPLDYGDVNSTFCNNLKQLLSNFGKEKVEVLEYFLSYDYLDFCNNQSRVKSDLNYYKNQGLNCISTFVVYNKIENDKQKLDGLKKYFLL